MLNRFSKLAATLPVAVMAFICLPSCTEKQAGVEVTDIKISMSTATILKGETVQLSAVTIPSNASIKEIEWESTNGIIASVDPYGLVTGVNEGETTIMARAGDIIKGCSIKVLPIPVSGITLDKEVVDMKVGENIKLVATVNPETAGNKTVEWSSSNTKIATVDNNGMVMAQASGEAVIVATAGDFSASCKIYSMGEVQIGDFYYDDGRWFSDPIEGKTPVGIVFYVGDPTKQDMALKADHPECKNGLALAIFGESSSTWQSNASKYGKLVSDWAKQNDEASKFTDVHQDMNGAYLNSIVGYSNTKVYELFNADEANKDWPVEAVEFIQDFRKQNPLPASTSGWYIPSAKELSLMCSGKYENNIGSMSESSLSQEPMIDMLNTLNQKMLQIPGSYLFTPNYYTSSTEGDIVKEMYSTSYTQWHIKMATGYIFNPGKTRTANAIRPVFAF